MKKALIICCVLVLVISVFSSCSSKKPAEESKAEKTSVTTEAKKEDTHKHDEQAKKPLDDASISSSDAIEAVKAFSEKQLKLDKKKDEYKWLVATVGKNIKGKDCFEIVASILTDTQGNKEGDTVSMQTVGTYYVTYDGKTVMIKDSKTAEITNIN